MFIVNFIYFTFLFFLFLLLYPKLFHFRMYFLLFFFTFLTQSHSVSHLFQLNADNAAVYDTVIFAGPPPMKQRLWPRHCVQDTWGSELHKDLKVFHFPSHLNISAYARL